jgi:ABC-type branched-subunit amino acid transport system substrate-binding protein
MEDARLGFFVKSFGDRSGRQASDHCITAHDAALVVPDPIARVAGTGKPVTRGAVREAIRTTHLETLRGVVSFDANGDLTNRIVNIFQLRHNADFPPDDIVHQYNYIGAAPRDAA